jgi:amino-acid N-acetyltransferase
MAQNLQATGAIRKARIQDVLAIHRLINFWAEKGEMLPRSMNEVYENLRDYFVCCEDEKLVGCAALHIMWSDLAEVKSVAVAPECQGKGIGRQLLKCCLNEAKQLGLPRVFALSFKPQFFVKNGFEVIDKNTLPQKVWSECIKCPKFPDCNETAVQMHLKP